jgi:hypothetical protein
MEVLFVMFLAGLLIYSLLYMRRSQVRARAKH